ncbi:MAG: hypothetical protein KJ905_02510 [Nanoarchaeota archaeon]|nr:hypothetical protein [Nanoarchaeota archaeon]
MKRSYLSRVVLVAFLLIALLATPSVSATPKDFLINSSAGDLFIVNGTTGNVGIGTTSPSAKLEIGGEK